MRKFFTYLWGGICLLFLLALGLVFPPLLGLAILFGLAKLCASDEPQKVVIVNESKDA